MRRLRWGVGAFLLLLIVVALGRLFAAPDVRPGSVLELTLEGEYLEAPEAPLAARLLGRAERSLLPVLSDLRKAERDERIGAVLLHVRDLGIGWGKAQELRDALTALREADRHPIVLIENESYDANLELYVASAAEEVYMAPGSQAPLVGLAAEYWFLGELWEKLGVELEVEQVGEYKSAAEMIAGRKMSEPHREMASALLDSMDRQLVAGIARGRGLEETMVREAIARGVGRPEELVEAGLADGVRTRDEILDARGEPPVVDAETWAAVDPTSLVGEPAATFALVYASGPVVNGEGTTSRTGSPILAADTVIEALEDAAEAPDVKAILLRVDSPGGSPFASELVWQAIRRVRESKPVIASMSDVAASGGYYVACAADVIVADPATLTGSIGAFLIRPVLGRVFDRLGVGTEAMTRGPHAEILLATRRLSDDTRAWLHEDVEAVYERFVARVAESRELDPERVDLAGRGRVWTGEQAKSLELVDELGGLRRASALAKEKVGLDPDADVALVVYPRPQPLAQQIGEALRGAAVRSAAAAVPFALPLPPVAVRALRWLEELPLDQPLLVPPFAIDIR